jgi:hypothetical protein
MFDAPSNEVALIQVAMLFAFSHSNRCRLGTTTDG